MQLWPAVLASPALKSSIKQWVIFTPRERAAGRRSLFVWAFLAVILATAPALAKKKHASATAGKDTAAIWADPGDIKSKDLFNGSGGEKHRPAQPLKFLK